MSNIDMYCITNKKLNYLEKLPYYLGGVGKEEFDDRYILPKSSNNILHKEKYYSELTFQYWIWKNKLTDCKKDWIGFCQKRRFWVKPETNLKSVNQDNLNENILTKIDPNCENYESFICNSIKVSNVKKIKLLKRGWKNLLKDPSIFFKKDKQSISLHFDMHHGYNNLQKAINQIQDKDKYEFQNYVNQRDYFNPHIMFISKPYVAKEWFDTLFPWLERCEVIFGFDNLSGYDTTRIYAYLAERYLSYWFKKYTRYKELPWVFINI